MSAGPIGTLLVANRGEIALRVFRTAAAMGIETVAVYSADDADALHVRRCDRAIALPGTGPAAYLDAAAVVDAAVRGGADAVHPGYGLLSESPELARACAAAGVTFVGPAPDALVVFGDKGRARELAQAHDVPVLAGTTGATTVSEMEKFVDELDAGAAVVIKAVAGGGGRGMRVVRDRAVLEGAFRECRAEAENAFGSGELYVEQLLDGARHVEVQVLGDGTGAVVHLGDRDCSVQRRHQKLIEVAPASGLDAGVREEILGAAVRLVAGVGYRGLATVEFLVAADGRFFFLEVNPRLQVEHTVTEEVLGIDLVRVQLDVAAGAELAALGLTQEEIPVPAGCAIQIRINAETLRPDATVVPHPGTVSRLDLPTGAGVRVDTAACTGHRINPRFDPLLAKIVVHDRSGFAGARRRAQAALRETVIEGVPTNLALQSAILSNEAFARGAVHTRFVDDHAARLVAESGADGADHPDRPAPEPRLARESGDPNDAAGPDGVVVLAAPMAGVVAVIEVTAGEPVAAGRSAVILESMKMQHPVHLDVGGTVRDVLVAVGDVVGPGDRLVHLEPSGQAQDAVAVVSEPDPDHIRPDLAALLDRRALLHDAARPEAVGRRHERGGRTARENVDDLLDAGLRVEYGGFAVAAQRSRRDVDDLIRTTPADGIIAGVGTVNGELFDADRTTCAVLAYDYTVLAGTQGWFNHKKTDRLLDVAATHRHPLVLFAEGGGGRPGDVDVPKVAGLNHTTFAQFGALSGSVPLVGIAAGRCFAGNAAVLGTCDVVIATENSTIGMSGPAMIEAGGLGRFTPEEVGPIEVQTRNGVVDVAVADEAEAVAVAKRYLGYFQGDLAGSEVPDQRRLRHVVPENRKRAYDVGRAVEILCDVGSVLELRSAFGRCVRTALVRIGGRPMGLIANNPAVLGGAIDADGADKLARFLQLCDVFGLPVVSLCDTPGFMVGPDAERTATVRHFSRLFVRGANLTVPVATVVLRKGYGLGAMAMAGGGFGEPGVTVSWPTGEFGGMGLEGAVRLGFRKELDAITDPQARERRYDELVEQMYERGSALNTAMALEIDDVIDPADTRDVLLASLPPVRRDGWTNPRLRPSLDAW